MALTPEQIKTALETLKAALNPLKALGSRVTLSPVLAGVVSKAEFQIFYRASRYQAPTRPTFNSPPRTLRTIEFRGNLVLKDLRDPETALPLLEEAKRSVVGLQLFGPHPNAEYDGALYPVGDSFTQLSDEAFWFYQLDLACQIEELLPLT